MGSHTFRRTYWPRPLISLKLHHFHQLPLKLVRSAQRFLHLFLSIIRYASGQCSSQSYQLTGCHLLNDLRVIVKDDNLHIILFIGFVFNSNSEIYQLFQETFHLTLKFATIFKFCNCRGLMEIKILKYKKQSFTLL